MDETIRLTADVVALATSYNAARVLLIRRRWEPFAGAWALPGGHVDAGESVEHAAERELAEETGIHALELDTVGTFHAPGRDPRGRYVTVAYRTKLPATVTPVAADDAAEARWVPVPELADLRLAFDHRLIIHAALT